MNTVFFTKAWAGLVSYSIVTSMCLPSSAQLISKSFEIRSFSNATVANGETDFKGKTAVFTTPQRVAFLNAYAAYGKIFWKDANLNKEVYPLDNALAMFKKLKARPVPQVRNRILNDEWFWRGYRFNQEVDDAAE